MKLDNDCIRDILLIIENMEYNSCYTVEKLRERLPNYSYDKLQYHCSLLLDAELIKGISVDVRGYLTPQVSGIFDLTYQGHQFLADIRSDTTWNKTKEIAKNVGSESIHTLKDIAISVITSAVHKTLGLP